ncbi:MAG: hypothetical protein BHV84_03660 [Prevotella sp. AG:487_50_53]|nr:MAG: hypothetical protein BHV84_03660 [Prevotella sp. AG:487_50_53]
MTKISYFILTRFNIPFNSQNKFLLETEYLSKRFSIFENSCFLSIQQQTFNNFKWLTFFDSRTPEVFKERNLLLQRKFPQYTPIYIDLEKIRNWETEPCYYNEIKRILTINNQFDIKITKEKFFFKLIIQKYISLVINSYCNQETRWIVTTRIDNDDCFHKNMMEEIYNHINSQPKKEFISFDNGLQYLTKSFIAQYFYYPNNHFTTTVEKRNQYIFTPFFWDHFYIEKYQKVTHIKTQPLWLEIIHRDNAINKIDISKNTKLCLGKVCLNDFGIHKSWKTKNLLYSLLLYPNIYLIPYLKHLYNIIKHAL